MTAPPRVPSRQQAAKMSVGVPFPPQRLTDQLEGPPARRAFATASIATVFETLAIIPPPVIPKQIMRDHTLPFAARVMCTMEEGLLGHEVIDTFDIEQLSAYWVPNATDIGLRHAVTAASSFKKLKTLRVLPPAVPATPVISATNVDLIPRFDALLHLVLSKEQPIIGVFDHANTRCLQLRSLTISAAMEGLEAAIPALSSFSPNITRLVVDVGPAAMGLATTEERRNILVAGTAVADALIEGVLLIDDHVSAGSSATSPHGSANKFAVVRRDSDLGASFNCPGPGGVGSGLHRGSLSSPPPPQQATAVADGGLTAPGLCTTGPGLSPLSPQVSFTPIPATARDLDQTTTLLSVGTSAFSSKAVTPKHQGMALMEIGSTSPSARRARRREKVPPRIHFTLWPFLQSASCPVTWISGPKLAASRPWKSLDLTFIPFAPADSAFLSFTTRADKTAAANVGKMADLHSTRHAGASSVPTVPPPVRIPHFGARPAVPTPSSAITVSVSASGTFYGSGAASPPLMSPSLATPQHTMLRLGAAPTTPSPSTDSGPSALSALSSVVDKRKGTKDSAVDAAISVAAGCRGGGGSALNAARLLAAEGAIAAGGRVDGRTGMYYPPGVVDAESGRVGRPVDPACPGDLTAASAIRALEDGLLDPLCSPPHTFPFLESLSLSFNEDVSASLAALFTVLPLTASTAPCLKELSLRRTDFYPFLWDRLNTAWDKITAPIEKLRVGSVAMAPEPATLPDGKGEPLKSEASPKSSRVFAECRTIEQLRVIDTAASTMPFRHSLWCVTCDTLEARAGAGVTHYYRKDVRPSAAQKKRDARAALERARREAEEKASTPVSALAATMNGHPLAPAGSTNELPRLVSNEVIAAAERERARSGPLGKTSPDPPMIDVTGSITAPPPAAPTPPPKRGSVSSHPLEPTSPARSATHSATSRTSRTSPRRTPRGSRGASPVQFVAESVKVSAEVESGDAEKEKARMNSSIAHALIPVGMRSVNSRLHMHGSGDGSMVLHSEGSGSESDDELADALAVPSVVVSHLDAEHQVEALVALASMRLHSNRASFGDEDDDTLDMTTRLQSCHSMDAITGERRRGAVRLGLSVAGVGAVIPGQGGNDPYTKDDAVRRKADERRKSAEQEARDNDDPTVAFRREVEHCGPAKDQDASRSMLDTFGAAPPVPPMLCVAGVPKPGFAWRVEMFDRMTWPRSFEGL